ncbi:SMI1/KNR4 family protein [Streptomyces sp. NPDC093109]|uniref:SMI1/KNR4 family protein n=1 Tax=Streptomyces sp. NPDC093109 TaxID=3154977 RepID=UPI00344D309A
MRPDLVLLRELIEASPVIATRPGGGVAADRIAAAESAVGPLSVSYRWWLGAYGGGTLSGAAPATVVPPGAAGAEEDITAGWRLDAGLLCFFTEPDGGDSYHFDLGRRTDGEHPVIRRDHFSGAEEQAADSFAGFLTGEVALSNGLGLGPVPGLARLWRSTPGVLLPNGVHVYGPHDLLERNETYGVADYAPDWLLIGDDSGGSGLFVRRHGEDRGTVHLLDLGAGERDIAGCGVSRPVTDDLLGWLGDGAPLHT